jgi:hypothetical protein
MFILDHFDTTPLIISCAQCKNIWGYDLPAGYNVILEQGKPLQLQNSYTKLQLMDFNGTLDAQDPEGEYFRKL